MTPLDPRAPYIAVDDASFRTSIDSMSPGLISFRSAPMTPSTTTNGSLSPCKELPPRTRSRSSAPGCAFVVCTCNPGASPAIAWSARASGLVSMSWLDTEPTEPVRSFLSWVPYPTATTASSWIAWGCSWKSAVAVCPGTTTTFESSAVRYPMTLARTRYVPVGTVAITYRPSEPVTAPKRVAVTVTLTPPSSAPDWPRTVPWICPVGAWEDASAAASSTTQPTRQTLVDLIGRAPGGDWGVRGVRRSPGATDAACAQQRWSRIADKATGN